MGWGGQHTELGRGTGEPAVLTWEHHTRASRATSALQTDPGVTAERNSDGSELKRPG